MKRKSIIFVLSVIILGMLLGTIFSLFIGNILPEGNIKDFFLLTKSMGFGAAENNWSDFGLGAAVFTADLKRGEEIARKKIRAGSCFVNDFVKSDPRLPFGGVKNSGYGRELSIYGMMEFVNVKTIVVNKV